MSKAHYPPCCSCRELCQFPPFQETECFRPPDFAITNSGHQLCMPTVELKQGWHKRYSRLQAKDGYLWLLQWLAPLAKLWADLGLRPVVGTTVDIKLWPYPLEHKELVLLLSCWKRWDHVSISGSAINTWLRNVNLAVGPDCEDSSGSVLMDMSHLSGNPTSLPPSPVASMWTTSGI